MSEAVRTQPDPPPTPKAVQSPLTLVMKIKSAAAFEELKAVPAANPERAA